MNFCRRLFRTPAGAAGLTLTALVILVSVLAPILAPQTFERMSADILRPAGRDAWFGTDQFGRDVFSRTLYGLRLSLQVAAMSAGAAAVAGTCIGVVAGYFGGWFDTAAMRLMEIMMAFPPLLLAIGIMTMLGSSLTNVIIAIGLVYLPVFARVARAPVLALREEEMVQAARAVGASTSRLLLKYVVPNTFSPVVVQTSLAVSNAILTEAALSYLGLGVRPPIPSLGGLIHEGQAMMLMAPWLAVFPGMTIAVAVFALNLLGDSVRDLLDPRLRQMVEE